MPQLLQPVQTGAATQLLYVSTLHVSSRHQQVRVVNEAMRLYPQPPVLIRRALETDKFGEIEVCAFVLC